MYKKLNTIDLDIPKDDIECWTKYPKYRWVYDFSRLLDSQHVDWSPFYTSELTDRYENIQMECLLINDKDVGHIYIAPLVGTRVLSELYVIKGEIKFIRHISSETHVEYSHVIGSVELRLSAFVTMHFHKFTGVLSVETCSNTIIRVRLNPSVDINTEVNQEVIKLLKRIYRKADSTVIGLTDQILHESLAS